jgi:hypothetical protein
MNLTQEELKNMSEDVKRLNPEICTETGLIAKFERLQSKKVVSNSQAKESPQKRQTTIKIGYPGSVITENHYLGRNGKATYVKPEAREFQKDLIAGLEACGVRKYHAPIKVTMTGVFKNENRRPDMQNMKCVYDAIETFTGLNDKDFYTETIPGTIDKNQDPHLLIKIAEL